MEELKKALESLELAIKDNDTLSKVRVIIDLKQPKPNKANDDK